MSKTKSAVKLTVESVREHMDNLGEVLFDSEIENLDVLIEVVNANHAWHKHRDDTKAQQRMQNAREAAGRCFEDMGRRGHLLQIIYDMSD
jgi:hypothetical protein